MKMQVNYDSDGRQKGSGKIYAKFKINLNII